MIVLELAALLEQCDPHAVVVAHMPFQGVEEITVVERKMLGGLGLRRSTELISVVEISNGNASHMKSMGIDVLPEG